MHRSDLIDDPASAASAVPVTTAPIAVAPGLRATLPQLACGRVIVIDALRFWQCGTWVGDLTVAWRAVAPGQEFVELAPIDGVRVYANRTLPRLLRDGGATLELGGLIVRRGLRINLDRPELWIDYLDHPRSFGLPGA